MAYNPLGSKRHDDDDEFVYKLTVNTEHSILIFPIRGWVLIEDGGWGGGKEKVFFICHFLRCTLEIIINYSF